MAQQFVNSKLRANKVVVFGKTSCPYCHKAMDLLKKCNLTSEHLEYCDIATQSDMDDIQDYLLKITGARTVPRIFFGQKCIGGYSDLHALEEKGELIPILKQIGAL
ncbi:glutaredoxin-1 [Hemicordylus capensis]|uniref:glutaredoxin-1 n=1 Tax=Hemicordylus capensis TaxID=884348 RepID=UPI00230478EA|nr:glutaredoxin-1 [Hemicordylus capensis]